MELATRRTVRADYPTKPCAMLQFDVHGNIPFFGSQGIHVTGNNLIGFLHGKQ